MLLLAYAKLVREILSWIQNLVEVRNRSNLPSTVVLFFVPPIEPLIPANWSVDL